MRAGAVTLQLVVALPTIAHASGHGPVYGLATPTLGRGGWSLDVAAMARFAGASGDLERRQAMLRGMLGYGVTEDVQLSISVPVPLEKPGPDVPPARVMAMMPGQPDIEALLAWRFHRVGHDVGSRIESTALFGLDIPTDSRRAGLQTSPALLAGAVTGYASRSIYAWLGALYRRSTVGSDGNEERTGDLLLFSLVVGYRPLRFRQELPHPDWRIFLETVGESTRDARAAGRQIDASGGHELFVGPTLLGLYGAWGISGGPLFPVASDPPDGRRGDRARLVVNYTRWF